VLLLALLLGACGGEDTDSLRAKNEAANRLFLIGDYQGALNAYQELLAERPDVDELSYNAGNALHRLQSYERAVAATSRVLPPRQVGLGVASYYALGNHLLQLGQYPQAYAAYRAALLIDPADADSKHNLELVLRLALAQEPPPAASQQPGDQPGDSQPGDAGTPGPGEPDPSGEPDPNASPQPGASPEPGGSGSSQDDATPQATPGPGGSTQRTLAEALAGIDEELSFEDAIEILDLLREQQQAPRAAPGGGSGPDY
jgi:tetratricopeptide (TPR) repeat protein